MEVLKRASLLAAFFVALFSIAGVRAAPADAGPGDVVKDATNKLQTLINQRRAEFEKDKTAFYTSVDEVVTPAFDVPYVAQITLGRTWRSATEDQRTRFQNAFKKTLIRAYADTLLENSGTSQFDWARSVVNGDSASLHATVVRKSGQPVAMGFELHKTAAGDWRAYDISVEGVSLITNFRSQFSSEVKQNGLDALIARLERGG